MSNDLHDVVIVGGGVAGLVAAWELREHDVVLVEASDRIGGRLLSYPAGEYWMNLGGHLFPGAESTLGRVVDELGLRTIEIPGSKFGIAWKGKTYAKKRVEVYPLSLPMSIRERFAFCVTGLKVLRNVAGWRRNEAAGADTKVDSRNSHRAQRYANSAFRDLIGRPRKNVGLLFDTAARRSSAELDELSQATAAHLFAAVWAGEKSSLAFNLHGGSAKLAEAFVERMSGRIRYNTQVTSVEPRDGEVLVECASDGTSSTVRARRVIVATPAPVAAQIVKALPEAVRRCLADVSYGSFVAMGAITSEVAPWELDDVYAVTTPDCAFDMLFNHANPLRTGLRQPGGSLMVYAGGDRARAMLEWTDTEISEHFMADILRLYPNLRGRISTVKVQRWPVGLSFNRPGFSLRPVLEYSRAADSVHLCGDYFGDMGNMETAAQSGSEAAANCERQLAACD